MKEQISEGFANLLLNYYHVSNKVINIKETIKMWKEKGFIKKSLEDKIKELKIQIEVYYRNMIHEEYLKQICDLQKELIEILDNKLKDK